MSPGEGAAVRYLLYEEVLRIIPRLPGSPAGPVRDPGLLASAAARPQMTVGAEDAYPDLYSKAAALLHSLVRNHPLVDGNKRLGWAACVVFLRMNGVSILGLPAGYDLVVEVADLDMPTEKIAETLRVLASENDAT